MIINKGQDITNFTEFVNLSSVSLVCTNKMYHHCEV